MTPQEALSKLVDRLEKGYTGGIGTEVENGRLAATALPLLRAAPELASALSDALDRLRDFAEAECVCGQTAAEEDNPCHLCRLQTAICKATGEGKEITMRTAEIVAMALRMGQPTPRPPTTTLIGPRAWTCLTCGVMYRGNDRAYLDASGKVYCVRCANMTQFPDGRWLPGDFPARGRLVPDSLKHAEGKENP